MYPSTRYPSNPVTPLREYRGRAGVEGGGVEKGWKEHVPRPLVRPDTESPRVWPALPAVSPTVLPRLPVVLPTVSVTPFETTLAEGKDWGGEVGGEAYRLLRLLRREEDGQRVNLFFRRLGPDIVSVGCVQGNSLPALSAMFVDGGSARREVSRDALIFLIRESYMRYSW